MVAFELARLIVWCKACGHQVETDAAEMAERYGVETTVPEWRERLECFRCGSRNVDMVVTGTEQRQREPGMPAVASGSGWVSQVSPIKSIRASSTRTRMTLKFIQAEKPAAPLGRRTSPRE